ncbi:MAG: tryptophan synthase subunit alpha [Promicromonosporaceae bacterium]|nr:tryptophan synthase subunit alpha [Promicromonosporaceae bacterium]
MSAKKSQTAAKLAETRAAGRAALIGYLPLGFPTVEQSVEAVATMVNAGVDIVELGLPYSDPVMDGPTIQAAVQVALANGARPRDIFPAVAELRAQFPKTPMLAMTYYNPVLKYGVEKFAADLATAGGAGLITADLVPDQAAEWIAAAEAHDLDRIFLIAPDTPDDRLALVAHSVRGFVYAASTMGVTGARAGVDAAARSLVARAKAAGAEFVCVGLGVSTSGQAAEVGSYADGVIVGSALVEPLLDESVPWGDRLAALAAKTSELASGIARARV